MKIGVWLDRPVHKQSGGSYSYYNSLISGIDGFAFSKDIEIIYVSNHQSDNLIRPVINIQKYKQGISYFQKIIRKGLKIISKNFFSGLINYIDQKEKRLQDQAVAAELKNQNVKIIFYPLPASPVINGIPYILNNWDLGHYSTYAFPEITDDNGFVSRNDWYVKIMPSALMIFCETEAGKKEIAHYLNVNPVKIKVLPMFASNAFVNMKVPAGKQLEIMKEIGLQSTAFFFYPAQFWAHKNHYNLVKAFKKFVEIHPNFKLVLCGSDKGNASYIKQVVKSLSLGGNVIMSGFVDEVYLYTLYTNACAMVMPTFFGPSNIPPLEALHLNCPVLCSDIDGHKELLGDCALYFDPASELSIFESMSLITDNSKRAQLLEKQNAHSKSTDHTVEKALTKLDKHFTEIINIRNCWE